MNQETAKKQLETAQCEPCHGGIDAMDDEKVFAYLPTINSNWQLHNNNNEIVRSFKFKNFAKTMFFVNAIAHMADQQGHHPDVEFGYNYCRVKFTTHEAGGLTTNDFICANRVDVLLQQ